MPPPPGRRRATILYLRKDNLKDQLREPLLEDAAARRRRRSRRCPTPGEAATIDKLTLPHMFTYTLTALQTGGAALILDPAPDLASTSRAV